MESRRNIGRILVSYVAAFLLLYALVFVSLKQLAANFTAQPANQHGQPQPLTVTANSTTSDSAPAESAHLASLPQQEQATAPLPAPSAEEAATLAQLGREVAILRHMQDGEEYTTPLADLVAHGKDLFVANWTAQEGAGRPMNSGTGKSLTDFTRRLVFPDNFNRISGPDANSCAGCHNAPFGVAGGGGDFVANVFVTAQRFDFVTFDPLDTSPIRGAVDERGQPVTLQNVGNSRATLGMFGSGYIEMLARQITADLQRIRDTMNPGESAELHAKGISFGTLSRDAEGKWDMSKVVGLPLPSVKLSEPTVPPTLIIQPFHQAGSVISLRQFTNNAFPHHHGIQTAERFGKDVDRDEDGFANEMTRADVTAVTVFQATMAVPGRVIPNNPIIEQAIWTGEQKFVEIGCTACHTPQLPLDNNGWVFTEPNPYNLADDLRPGEAPELAVDLSDPALPQPRLPVEDGVVWVPAYTDLKLHDITSGPDDPNRESINMQAKAGSEAFFAGNSKFVTRKLWGAANEPPYFHHGLYTTLREATLAHAGEALVSREAFEALSEYEQNAIIEFLKSLQVLPSGTSQLVVDENGNPRAWPPK